MTSMTLSAPSPLRRSPPTFGFDPSTPRFTVEQYQKMIEAGVFADGPKIELLDGYLVLKMTKSALHDGVIQLLNRSLIRLLPSPWDVRIQSVVQLSESEPEPDLAVVRGLGDQFLGRIPRASDIGLLVEVSDSTLRRDQGEKAAVCARDGVANYWIVNLIDRCVEVYTSPTAPGVEPATYLNLDRFEAGRDVPLVLDGRQVGVVPAAAFFP